MCALLLSACGSADTTTAPSSVRLFSGRLRVPQRVPVQRHHRRWLSAISYDPGRGVYYVISDDRSEKNPARFYTVRITFPDNRVEQRRVAGHHAAAGPHGQAVRAVVARCHAAGDPAGSRGHRVRRTRSAAVLVERGGADRQGSEPPAAARSVGARRRAGRRRSAASSRCRAGCRCRRGTPDPAQEHGTGGPDADAERPSICSPGWRTPATTTAICRRRGRCADPHHPVRRRDRQADRAVRLSAGPDHRAEGRGQRAVGSCRARRRELPGDRALARHLQRRPASTGPASPVPTTSWARPSLVDAPATADDQGPGRRPVDRCRRCTTWTTSRESRWAPSWPTARQSVVLVSDDNFSPEQITQFWRSRSQ